MESTRITMHDGIATLQMMHGRANALDIEFCQQLTGLLQALAETARAVILTGTGNIFSAGVDLVRLQAEGAPYIERFLPELSTLLRALFEFPLPLVAAINGHAVAGGCIMACAADYRIMARGNGRIGVPELRVGVPFPTAAFELLRFTVPAHRLQAVLYGATFLPEEAIELGLTDEVVPADALFDRTHTHAIQLAELPPTVFAMTKQQVRAPVLKRMAAGEWHDRRVQHVWQQPETLDRIRSYMERTFKPRPA